MTRLAYIGRSGIVREVSVKYEQQTAVEIKMRPSTCSTCDNGGVGCTYYLPKAHMSVCGECLASIILCRALHDV